MSKHIPILFSTPMVQAILAGRKTMTRRKVKALLDNRGLRTTNVPFEDWHGKQVKCPYGQPGDVLWVRETFKQSQFAGVKLPGFDYKADHVKWLESNGNVFTPNSGCEREMGIGYTERWRPSLFMPKAACRIFLKIKDVRVERLWDISEQDAKAEGVEFIEKDDPYTYGYQLYGDHLYTDILGRKAVTGTALESFETLWQKINGPESWDENPWVWVVSFERIEKPANF